MTRKVIEIFIGTAAIATILPLIIPPLYAFFAWLGLFTTLLIFFSINQHLIVARVIFGYDKTLNFLDEVLEEGRGKQVFTYSNYTIPDKLAQHHSYKKLSAMLKEEAFEKYTRVAVLCNKKHLEMHVAMLSEHGNNIDFRFGVMPASRAIPINIFTISSGLIVIAIPGEVGINQAQGDAVAICIRSKRIYTFFSALNNWVWNNSLQVKLEEALNENGISEAVANLKSIFEENQALQKIPPTQPNNLFNRSAKSNL